MVPSDEPTETTSFTDAKDSPKWILELEQYTGGNRAGRETRHQEQIFLNQTSRPGYISDPFKSALFSPIDR